MKYFVAYAAKIWLDFRVTSTSCAPGGCREVAAGAS